MSTEQQTALTVVDRAVAALGQNVENEKALVTMAEGSKSITAITNADGYQQCHAARMALKNKRIEIEKLGKKAREDATAFGKAVIVEEKRLIALISPEEERLETLQKAWDDARERERQEKIEQEILRVQTLQERVAKLRGCQTLTASSGSSLIAEHIEDLEKIPVDDSFQEFRQQAEDAKAAGLSRLRDLHAAAVAHEAEQARIQAEREELARLRARQEEWEAAERFRLAEEARRAAEERERLEAEARARREAEEAELRRQREEEAAEQQRVERIRQWIVALNGPTHLTATHSPTLIRQAMQDVHNAKVTEADYSEFLAEAMDAQISGSKRLSDLLSAAEAYRAEQQRIADERAELDRQRAENEQREREARERQEAEERRLAEERARFQAEQEAARKAPEPEHIVLSGAPTALEIVEALAIHYDESQEMVLDWLRGYDFCAVTLEQEEAA